VKIKVRQILEILAFAAMVAAIFVPGASAYGERPDDRAALRGPGAVPTRAAIRPDDRGGIRGAGPMAGSGAVIVALDAKKGFAWDAAAFGAAATLVVILLFAGATLGARHARQLRAA